MPIKVLVVLDGGFRFDASSQPPGIPDFTYSTVVETLSAAGMQVTKAHRGSDSAADLGMQMFDFAGAAVDLLQYDVIWLIGYSGRNDPNFPPSPSGSIVGGLGPAQLDAISHFMEQGGGIFATGDHDSIGADMGGHIPRVRAMRSWFGQADAAKPAELATIPPNFPPTTADRADTIQPSPLGVYTAHPAPFVWFENQSDSTPQPITPSTSPAHPILRRNGADITVYPDHMHEGRSLGEVPGHNYAMNSPYGDTAKPEFPLVAGNRELPALVATGQALAHSTFFAATANAPTFGLATAKTAYTLSSYDGRVAGVGRIVTGATFHHYVDINLTGDSTVTAGTFANEVGGDAVKGHGFNDNAAVFDQIRAVYVNITNWLARPRPAIGLILERSTFSQDEVAATLQFDGAILLTVDGLRPNQFPGGGIPALGAVPVGSAWAPTIAAAPGIPIAIEPMTVASDDPTMPDRVQRFTFVYRVRFTGDAFGFPVNASSVAIEASLHSTALSTALTDQAWLELVKSANPFMLDLADGNQTSWLSSDVRVFHVVAGDDLFGVPLAANASRSDALEFIRNLASTISSAQFASLPSAEASSSLSPIAMTTGSPPRRVYNFALARVRLSGAGADADEVRVFFRIFTSQTTAALTYNLDGGGVPTGGYLQTAGADPVAAPGTQNGGADWVSFPVFATTRHMPQDDPDNIKTVVAATGFKLFGALVDNNLPDPYLTQTPVSGGALQPLPTLLMGEHQCIVAQIDYAGTPIPSGATPWTSDKLSQRNIAFSTVANPGLDASRTAIHTFEIEATPQPIAEGLPPDELLIEWSARTPAGTTLRIDIPSWNADDVVELADRFYARHEIEAIDAHGIELPAGGMRYVPIPMSHHRQTGVISVEFPLGIEKGQRFDVSVRQVTNRTRHANVPPPKIEKISLEEAERMVAALDAPAGRRRASARAQGGRGVFDLGDNRVLITDLSVIDAVSDHALIVEAPDPAAVAAALAEAGRWREPIGAFQLGIPVSTRGAMLLYHEQLLSIMRWRAAHLPRRSRWRRTMFLYLELLTAKVQALGGNPSAIPATPDGAIPQLPSGQGGGFGDGSGGGPGSGGGGAGGQTVDAAVAAALKHFMWRFGLGLLLLVLIILLLFWMLLH